MEGTWGCMTWKQIKQKIFYTNVAWRFHCSHYFCYTQYYFLHILFVLISFATADIDVLYYNCKLPMITYGQFKLDTKSYLFMTGYSFNYPILDFQWNPKSCYTIVIFFPCISFYNGSSFTMHLSLSYYSQRFTLIH